MNKILAIGGAVIKTAKEELLQVIKKDKTIVAIYYNGGALFHDFQLATEEDKIKATGFKHSYSIDYLKTHPEVNENCSELVWRWISQSSEAPENSIVHYCEDNKIYAGLFTVLGGDFWQTSSNSHSWGFLADKSAVDFYVLTQLFTKPFHYICMGSAVVHPEVFLKALHVTQPKNFRADVVDFMDMYRPKTRVAKYGDYYKTTHKEFLDKWLNGEIYAGRCSEELKSS